MRANKIVASVATLTLSAVLLVAAGSVERGKKLFSTKAGSNCIACHDVNGENLNQPGVLGPKLTGLKHWPEDMLYDRLYDPTVANPLSAMPPFGANAILTEGQLRDLVAYLKTID